MEYKGLQFKLPLVDGKQSEPPCPQCPAICCHYFALQIDTPGCKNDFENIRWYLMHTNTHVFVDAGKWYLQVWNPCVNITPDNRCGIYETRPLICRGYGVGEDGLVNCHATSENNSEYELLFTEPEQLEKHYQAWHEKRYGKRKAAAQKGASEKAQKGKRSR